MSSVESGKAAEERRRWARRRPEGPAPMMAILREAFWFVDDNDDEDEESREVLGRVWVDVVRGKFNGVKAWEVGPIDNEIDISRKALSWRYLFMVP